jgi:phosphohistidine phosphatase SixA
MKLYLQRHCQSEDGEPLDPTRQLTEQGRDDAKTMAAFLAREVPHCHALLTSGFARALETAQPEAEALDCEPIVSPLLDPNGDPKRAWRYIQAMAKGSGDDANIIVVTHHPLSNLLLELLTGAKVDDVHWEHGAVAHVHHDVVTGEARLGWLVPPHVLEDVHTTRDVIEAIRNVGRLLQDELGAEEDGHALMDSIRTREVGKKAGLAHPKHADIIRPIRAKVKSLFVDFFRYQGAAILKRVKLEVVHESKWGDGVEAFAEGDGDKEALAILPDTLHPLSFSLDPAQAVVYNDLIAQAIEKAAEQLATEEDWQASLPNDAVETFLRTDSLAKLTGELNETTKQRLRDAIADAYDEGGSYQDIVDAVTDTVEEFSTVRASMIAQTEVNAAYNYGRRSIALAAGSQEHAWDPDGIACPLCMLNVVQGFIPIDEDFASGDDAPPAHPNCDCSTSFRISSE